jgi:glycosyltransferase involved in cell wall biosynthesis
MRIAQVSPLFESVPPKAYGGTERVVSYLTEELVERGHEVTLFASGDSKTRARLISSCPVSLRLSNNCKNELMNHVVQLQMVQDRLQEFDVIHYHTDYFHYPLSKLNRSVHLTTLHGRLDIPDLQHLYNTFQKIPLVSISDSQRKPLPQANWINTVYHGLPKHLYSFHERKGEYFAFLGRICPEKGVERSIELAKRTGIPLKMAAKVDEADKEYYERIIKPQLNHPLIEYIGEIGEKEKNEFLGKAICTLFLIDWPEPFGLVMIESMACGTPVLACGSGSVPEIIDNGITGCMISSIDQVDKAVHEILKINRRDCRDKFEERFSVQRMTTDYLKTFHQLVEQSSKAPVFNLQ